MFKKQVLIAFLLLVVFTFTGCDIFAPTLTPSNYLSVSAFALEGGTATGTGNYEINSNVTVVATANEGYTFSNWTKNGAVVSESATYTFVVTENIVLYANFIYAGGEEGTLSGTFYRVEQDTETNFITRIELLTFISNDELTLQSYHYNDISESYSYDEQTNSYIIDEQNKTLSVYDYNISQSNPIIEYTYTIEENVSLELAETDKTYTFYVYVPQSLTGLFENNDSTLYYQFSTSNYFSVYYGDVTNYDSGSYLLFNNYCIITLNNLEDTILVYEYTYSNNTLTLVQNNTTANITLNYSEKVKVTCSLPEDEEYILGLGFYNINDTVNIQVLPKQGYVLTGIRIDKFIIPDTTSHSFTVEKDTSISLVWAEDDGGFIPMPN